MKTITILCCVLLVVSCASVPTPEELSSADYGRLPEVGECEALVEEHMETRLKDARSTRYRHGVCNKSWWSSVPIMGLPKVYGYGISGRYNAKNSFGAYTGYKEYKALINNGRIVRMCIVKDGMCVPEALH